MTRAWVISFMVLAGAAQAEPQRGRIVAAATAAAPGVRVGAAAAAGRGHVVAGAAGGNVQAVMARAPVGPKAGAVAGTIHVRRADGKVVPVTIAAAWNYGP